MVFAKVYYSKEALGSYHFLAHGGGCGRNGMKDSVKFFYPPLEAAGKLLIPLSICENSCDSPLKPPPPKVCGFIMMSCRHAKVIALASWGSGGAVRSPGQSLRGGPGVRAHRGSENPGVSSSKNGL